MYGSKGWIFPIIVLIALIATISVGIYQLYSENNPWNLGGSGTFKQWSFLTEGN
jgi:hypothetical protein